jgi:hypothetical protein
MKIYIDDPVFHGGVCPYRNTEIDPLTTKMEIDGLLARWGIKLTAWEWDLQNGKVVLQFQFEETVQTMKLNPVIKMPCPTLWTKGTRRRTEAINWKVSMRVFYWFLKSLLEMAHLFLSDKTTAFLPYIINSEGKQLREVVIPNLEKVQGMPCLPEIETERKR